MGGLAQGKGGEYEIMGQNANAIADFFSNVELDQIVLRKNSMCSLQKVVIFHIGASKQIERSVKQDNAEK